MTVAVAIDIVDWESPCGPADGSRPRVHHPRHVFEGPGDAHWSGQPCELLGPASADDEMQMVALACGCRVEVPGTALVPAP